MKVIGSDGLDKKFRLSKPKFLQLYLGASGDVWTDLVLMVVGFTPRSRRFFTLRVPKGHPCYQFPRWILSPFFGAVFLGGVSGTQVFPLWWPPLTTLPKPSEKNLVPWKVWVEPRLVTWMCARFWIDPPWFFELGGRILLCHFIKGLVCLLFWIFEALWHRRRSSSCLVPANMRSARRRGR